MGRRPLSVKPYRSARYVKKSPRPCGGVFLAHFQRCVQAGGRTSGLTIGLTGGLDVKAEMEHIAINNFIVASFDA